MNEVRTELEIVVSEAMAATNLFDVPVVAGASDAVRPDRYIAVVALEAEPRGSASIVELEIRVVAPVDGNPVSWLQETLRKVSDWAQGADSHLNGYNGDTLKIFGSAPPTMSSEVLERQRAEIITMMVGAMAS
jgi:hypothetical protein